VNSSKKVNPALQGGDAHGAFVWGVLDELLEDGRLSIDAISATSAGAMNAVVVAYGMTVGGPKAARDKLRTFWRAVSRMERLFGLAWSPFDRLAQTLGLPPESISPRCFSDETPAHARVAPPLDILTAQGPPMRSGSASVPAQRARDLACTQPRAVIAFDQHDGMAGLAHMRGPTDRLVHRERFLVQESLFLHRRDVFCAGRRAVDLEHSAFLRR
jgi:hypothetical protein